MCPIERKEIEGWVKEAGINEDEILAAVDLEMRMRMAKTNCQQSKMIVSEFESKVLVLINFKCLNFNELDIKLSEIGQKQIHDGTSNDEKRIGSSK